MTRYPIKVLIAFITDLLTSAGMPRSDAACVADFLVDQEARGIVTHGLRLVQYHIDSASQGLVNLEPEFRTLRDDAAVVVIDMDGAVGIIAAMRAMDAAIERAREFGVGIAIAACSNYAVSTGPYCRRAAEQDMLGIVTMNAHPTMGYPGAQGRVIGNNPMGFAAPTEAGFPIVFDVAMTISGGMLSRLKREGLPIPLGLIGLDDDGEPTRDPNLLKTPMPIGSHKGAGFALLTEILTGVLSGGAFLKSVIPAGKRTDKREAQSQCCIAIDVERFMPRADFRRRMAELIADLKDNPLAPGSSEIRVPGERMAGCFEQACREGVVVEDDVKTVLTTFAQQWNVNSPFEKE